MLFLLHRALSLMERMHNLVNVSLLFFFWYARDTFRTTGIYYLQKAFFSFLFLSSCLMYSLSGCPGGNLFVNDYFRYCPLNLSTNSVYFKICRIWLCLLRTCYLCGRHCRIVKHFRSLHFLVTMHCFISKTVFK